MAIGLTRVSNAGASKPEELTVVVQLIGTLQKGGFDVLGPRLDVLVEQHGKLNLLVEPVDFEGWTAGAVWEDVKLALDRFNEFERIAIVGENRREHSMTVLAKPFTAAEVRYFDVDDKHSAELWVQQKAS